jgi:selenide,water dikinase
MAEASNVSIHIDFSALRFFPTVRSLAEQDIVPGGTKRNLSYFGSTSHFSDQLDHIDRIMAADAQTSGGMLFCMLKDQAHRFLDKYNQDAAIQADVVGRVDDREDFFIFFE